MSCLIHVNYTCRQNFKRYVVPVLQTWVHAQAQVISLHITISFVVALYERLGSLKICALSPL